MAFIASATLSNYLLYPPKQHRATYGAAFSSQPQEKKAAEAAFSFTARKNLCFFQHARHGPGLSLGERPTRFDFDQVAHFGGAGFVVGVVFL